VSAVRVAYLSTDEVNGALAVKFCAHCRLGVFLVHLRRVIATWLLSASVMRRLPVKILGLAIVAALLAIALGRSPPGPEEPPPPAADPQEAVRQPLPETALLRPVAKRRLAREVIAGRLSLWQAAAQFGALNRLPPEAAYLSRIDLSARPPHLSPRTDEERLCWQVISYVEAELWEEPGRARSVVARLEAELQEGLRKQGRIRLPAPPSPARLQELLDQARQEAELILWGENHE
jgi:hypothetical protein